MGCDIHTCVERLVKGRDGEEDFWWNADHYVHNRQALIYDDEPEYERVELCGDRDYSLFATLTDVRNYAESPYICDPKGIPKDASSLTRSEYDRWGGDAHSTSYFTLEELKAFRAENPVQYHSGYISPRAAELLDNGGELPTMWCQGTSSVDWVHRRWEDPTSPLDRMIDELERRSAEIFYFYKEDNDSKIRIVFWFDN